MRVAPFLLAFGIILQLGGLGHCAGIAHLYFMSGVPDANRVLLDVWIAEAQLLGGGLYIAASRAQKAGTAWRVLALFGALTVIGYAAAFVPVIFARAPWPFRIPPTLYLIASAIVAVVALRKTSRDSN